MEMHQPCKYKTYKKKKKQLNIEIEIFFQERAMKTTKHKEEISRR
jgi:hypothetical protein